MSRMYTLQIAGVSYTNAAGGGTAFSLISPADAITVIHSIRFGQQNQSGDANAAMISIALSLYTGAEGTGGTVHVPVVLEAGSALYGGTARINDVTTSAASQVGILRDAFNVQAGWLYLPTPSERIIVSPSDKFAVELGQPDADITVHATLIIEEIGG